MKNRISLALALHVLLFAGLASAQSLKLTKDSVPAEEHVVLLVEGAASDVRIEDLTGTRKFKIDPKSMTVDLGSVEAFGCFTVAITREGSKERSEYALLALPSLEGDDLTLTLTAVEAADPAPSKQDERSAGKLLTWAAKENGVFESLGRVFPNWAKENAVNVTGTFAVCTTSTTLQPLVLVCADRVKDHAVDLGVAISIDLVNRCPDLGKEERETLTVAIRGGYAIYKVMDADSHLAKALSLLGDGIEFVDHDGLKLGTKYLSDSAKTHMSLIK